MKLKGFEKSDFENYLFLIHFHEIDNESLQNCVFFTIFRGLDESKQKCVLLIGEN